MYRVLAIWFIYYYELLHYPVEGVYASTARMRAYGVCFSVLWAKKKNQQWMDWRGNCFHCWFFRFCLCFRVNRFSLTIRPGRAGPYENRETRTRFHPGPPWPRIRVQRTIVHPARLGGYTLCFRSITFFIVISRWFSYDSILQIELYAIEIDESQNWCVHSTEVHKKKEWTSDDWWICNVMRANECCIEREKSRSDLFSRS